MPRSLCRHKGEGMLRRNGSAGMLIDICYSRSSTYDTLKVVPLGIIFSFLGLFVVFVSLQMHDGNLLTMMGVCLILLGTAVFLSLCPWSCQQIPDIILTSRRQSRQHTPVWSHQINRSNAFPVERTTSVEETIQMPPPVIMVLPERDLSSPQWQEIPITPSISPSPPPKYEPPPTYEEAVALQTRPR